MYDSIAPDTHADRPATKAWQAHVTAGRIGHRLPTPPEVAANRARTDAILARRERRA